MPNPVERFIAAIRADLASSAEEAMRLPKSDAFEHGIQVGRWQGMNEALNMLGQILRSDEDEENKS